MSLNVLSGLLSDFGASIGIADLSLDDEGRVNLMFDDIPLSIELDEGDESVSIYSLIDRLPPTFDCSPLYAMLLNANYIHQGTDGATLGVDEKTRNVVLIRREKLMQMRAAEFEADIERFINLAEHWKRLVYQAYNEGGAPAGEMDGGVGADEASDSRFGMRV